MSFESVFLLIAFLFRLASSSKILAVLPTVSRSHFDFFQPLLITLASRGHDLTVISSFPPFPPVPNYTDISVKDFKKTFLSEVSFDMLPEIPTGLLSGLVFLQNEISDFERTFTHPAVRRLLTSGETFDLVITELWNTDLFLGFAHTLDAPVVALSSCAALPWAHARFGNPDNPSYIPSGFLGKSGRLSLLDRVVNTVELVVAVVSYKVFFDPASESIARRAFGQDIPPLERLARNTSLLLVNTHHSLHGARPLSPQVVEVGGLHVREPRVLSQELDRWMNESTHGVVYFSFGSMLRGATLPADKVEAFVDVFRTLKQRVLWKWEEDTVEDLPANVKIMKWLPQRDVLAHPKVKVFISHGGLLGTTEAVVSSVPILGIPMYGDQPNNVAALVEQGVAVHVPYNDIRVDTLTNALNALLYDQSFSENARQLSRRFLDRPQSALDTAVYWTEYVIRHRGAPHLQSAAVHMPWYQLWLLDVVTVLLVGLSLTVTILYYLLRTVFKLIFCRNVTSNTKLKRS